MLVQDPESFLQIAGLIKDEIFPDPLQVSNRLNFFI